MSEDELDRLEEFKRGTVRKFMEHVDDCIIIVARKDDGGDAVYFSTETAGNPLAWPMMMKLATDNIDQTINNTFYTGLMDPDEGEDEAPDFSSN